MEKVPKPILSIIFSMVPSFDQVAKIATVCRKWKAIVGSMNHYVSFQRSDDPRCWSDKNSIFIMAILLEKFASPHPKMQWKLLHLDLKSLIIKKKSLSLLLLSQPRLLTLDLTNTTINLSNLWENLCKAKCEAEENDSSKTIEFSLEELRLTNNKRELGHYSIVKLFPNLKRLYAGNTQTNIFDFKKLIKNLPKLEILDISHCPDCQSLGDNYCQNVIKKYLKKSHLKSLFYTYFDISGAEGSDELIFEEFNGVKIINKSICEILMEARDENSLIKLMRDWLYLGGDVNVYNEFDNDGEIFSSWRYPHIEFIKNMSQKRAIEVFKMFLLYGLDLAANYFASIYNNSLESSLDSDTSSFDEDNESEDSDFETETNLLSLSGMTNKIELFEFFVRNSFPLANEKYFPKLPILAVDHLFKLYLNYEAPGYFPENFLTDALNKYLAANKNLETVWSIYEIIHKEKKESINERLKIVNSFLKGLSSDCSTGNEDSKLIFGNFPINYQDECGWTFLTMAAAFGNEEIVDMLLKNGADIHVKDKMGYTALHYAAERGYKKTVKKLLSCGAIPSTPAESGTSAISLAKINLHKEIVDILIKSEKENNESINVKLPWKRGKRLIIKNSPNK